MDSTPAHGPDAQDAEARERARRRASPGRDSQLLAAVRRGERAATESLVARLACIPEMLSLRERHLGTTLGPDERLEVVQETVAALWSKLGRFRGSSSLEAWVWGFVVRAHYKALQRRRRRSAREGLEGRDVAAEPIRHDHELHEALHARLRELGAPSEDIVRLRHFEALSFDDIAARVRMPTNTVKTRYYRALQRLRVLLGPAWREAVGLASGGPPPSPPPAEQEGRREDRSRGPAGPSGSARRPSALRRDSRSRETPRRLEGRARSERRPPGEPPP